MDPVFWSRDSNDCFDLERSSRSKVDEEPLELGGWVLKRFQRENFGEDGSGAGSALEMETRWSWYL
jgi:hypothetical protein